MLQPVDEIDIILQTFSFVFSLLRFVKAELTWQLGQIQFTFRRGRNNILVVYSLIFFSSENVHPHIHPVWYWSSPVSRCLSCNHFATWSTPLRIHEPGVGYPDRNLCVGTSVCWPYVWVEISRGAAACVACQQDNRLPPSLAWHLGQPKSDTVN